MYIPLRSSQLMVFVLSCITNKICWMFEFTPSKWNEKLSQIMYRKLTVYVICISNYVNDDNTIGYISAMLSTTDYIISESSNDHYLKVY